MEEDQPGNAEGASGSQSGSGGGYRWSATSFSADPFIDFTFQAPSGSTLFTSNVAQLLDTNINNDETEISPYTSTYAANVSALTYGTTNLVYRYRYGTETITTRLFDEEIVASPSLGDDEYVFLFYNNYYCPRQFENTSNPLETSSIDALAIGDDSDYNFEFLGWSSTSPQGSRHVSEVDYYLVNGMVP